MLKKTLFGNYKKSSVEEYVQQLNQKHTLALEKLQQENTQLKEQLEEKKRQESEIGEAIVHAKMMLRESREQAQLEAEKILKHAYEEYNEVQRSMVDEITTLTEKRVQAERIYQERVAEIKRTLDAIVFDLDDVVMEEEVAPTLEQEQKNNIIHFESNTHAS